MRRSYLLLCGLVVLLGGCETLPNIGGASTGKSAGVVSDQPITLNEGDKELTALADSRLPAKSCGMVLWTLDAQQPVPVFRFISSDEAEIRLSDQPILLHRIDYSGASGFGVFENQTFESEAGVSVEVTAKFGLGFSGGAYLERGLIKVRDTMGWSILAPAAGIAGCRE